MWLKRIMTPFIVCTILVILQISYGRPTENLVIQNTTTITTTTSTPSISTSTDLISLDLAGESDVNSSFLESVSILLTVLSPNDTSSPSPLLISAPVTAPTTTRIIDANSTEEPDYYDDQNNSTSSTLGELGDELDTSSMYLDGSSTEPSLSFSTASSLLENDEQLEVAGSLDESVTTNVLLLSSPKEDEDHLLSSSNNNNTCNETESSSQDSAESDRSTQSSEQDDRIIFGAVAVVSMSSSNLHPDTVEPPASGASDAGSGDGAATQEESQFSTSASIQDLSSDRSSSDEEPDHSTITIPAAASSEMLDVRV